MERSKAPKLRIRALKAKAGRVLRRGNVVRVVRWAPADFMLFWFMLMGRFGGKAYRSNMTGAPNSAAS